MSSEHDPLMAFVDGELTAAEQASFRAHLGDCESCRRELAELVQLRAIEDQTRRAAGGAGVFSLSRARAMKVLGVFAAAAAAAIFFALLRPAPKVALWNAGDSRSIEPWLSHPLASTHRPYDVMRSGSARSSDVLPLSMLAELEEKGELHALGAAWLSLGDARRAAEVLSRAGASAEVSSDLAAAYLQSGELHAALEASQRALDAAPDLAAARFNRALISERMGWPRSAHADLQRAAGAPAPGWAQEARSRADTMARSDTDPAALSFVQGMVDVVARGRVFPRELAQRSPAQALEIYTLAVLAARDEAELSRLQEIAELLDAALPRAGAGAHLAAARATAPRRFATAPWFRRLAITLAGLTPRAQQLELPSDVAGIDDPGAFLGEILKKGSPDQRLGALFYYRERAAYVSEWDKSAAAVKVPFFSCGSGWASFTYDWLGGKSSADALRVLEETIAECTRAGVERNVARAEHQRANVWFFSRDLVHAREAALRARDAARRLPDLRLEGQALEVLFNVARYRRDRALMRAIGEEWRLLDPRADRAVLVHEALANVSMFALDFAGARSELAAARATGAPLTIIGAFVLADLYRVQGNAEDLAQLESALKIREEEYSADPATQLLVRHILALARLRTARAASLEELRAIITEARVLEGDATAKSAEAYSVSLLALESGEDARHEDLIRVLAEEQKLAAPERCLVAIETHLERTVIAARDAQGRTSGRMLRGAAAGAAGPVVPRDFQTQLASCPELTVLARPALHGKAGLLDRSIAYSFLVGGTGRTNKRSGEVLYVYGAAPPASAELAPLFPLAVQITEGARVLTGVRATPRAVLAQLGEVGWAELHVHGKLYGDGDAAALALSAEGDADYRLRAEDVARARFREAPVVVLAACDAADVQREDLLEPAGLPIAFLHAGASAVLAADAPLADARAAEFFRDVRRRAESGVSVAVALRDARLAWPAEQHGWIDSIVVFEGGRSK